MQLQFCGYSHIHRGTPGRSTAIGASILKKAEEYGKEPGAELAPGRRDVIGKDHGPMEMPPRLMVMSGFNRFEFDGEDRRAGALIR